MKKIISIILTTTILVSSMSIIAFAGQDKDYIITNPYANVDWDSRNAYKTQLHCQTTASDGYQTIKEVIQRYYDLDYDIVAITDHGTINKGWDTAPDLVDLLRLIKKERTNMAPVEPLSAEEYEAYTTGTAATSEGIVRTHSTGMLDVPKGIELNMATPIADCHLTGYFSDYGQGLAGVFGDYETPSEGVRKAGGISMLSHVGEYVYTDKDSEDHVGQKVDEYYVNKFARIFLDNAGSSLGMGINSATDAHTRCDRILYDQILQKTIPNGVVPWGFTFSDSHNDTSLNDAYTMMLMPELTVEAFRECMENGEFFSVSHFSNGYELNGMQEIPGYVEEEVNYWSNETPMVTRLTVDEENDKIYVEGKNFNMITWVSDGEVILREENITDGKAVLDLHSADLLNDPELYVRFYLTGKDGICYSQPLTIQKDGEEFTPVSVPETHDVSTRLRTLVTVLDWLIFKWSPFVWAFKYFALGYDPIQQTMNDINSIFTGSNL